MDAERPAKGHVMIIDDEAPLREMLTRLLEDRGYQVTSMADGDEALAYLQKNPAPNVILLDLMMPRKNGWVFLAELRENPATREIPVVILSGVGDIDEQASRFKAFYLPKPTAPAVLLAAVECYCR